jgi:membrane protease YdiL (CAAX protease family)
MSTDLRPAPTRPKGQTGGVEILYIGAFVIAEVIGLSRPLAGAVCEAALLLALINHYALVERERSRPLLLGLAVVCLYRLLALTPVTGNPILNRVVLVGGPTLLATVLALRLVRPAVSLGKAQRPAGWEAMQILIGLTGIPLSWAAYKIFKPTMAITFSGAGRSSTGAVILAVVVLAVFSGVTEELLFRGLLHNAARTPFGSSALYVSAVVFGAAYLGTRSLAVVAFVVAVGAFFGWCRERSESTAGVAFAHACISVGVFVVWPSLSGHLTGLHV